MGILDPFGTAHQCDYVRPCQIIDHPVCTTQWLYRLLWLLMDSKGEYQVRTEEQNGPIACNNLAPRMMMIMMIPSA